MVPEKIEFYRSKADEALTKARSARDDHGKVSYERMAENWRLLADTAEKLKPLSDAAKRVSEGGDSVARMQH